MRMYQQEKERYHVLAPWESKDLRPVKSIVKTFQKPEYLVRNQDLSAREVKTLLPPIGSSKELSMEQTKLLKERLGVLLYSSRPDVINRIKKSFKSVDPLNQGRVTNNRLVEILKDHNVTVDDNTKRMLFQKFDPWQSGKCSYGDIIAFMSQALDEYGIERDRSEFANLPRHTQKSKVRHPSMNSSEFILAPIGKRQLPEDDYVEMPGTYSRTKLNHAFLERRDAGLRIEIERCFNEYKGQGDVYFMVMNLKKELLGREDDMIGPYKLKGIVTRRQLPLNVALVDKLIERLDPHGAGRVSCTEFMSFLEKALPLPKGYNGLGGNIKKQKQSFDVPPDKPRWETNQPLKAIKSNRNGEATTNGKSSVQQNSKEFDRFMKLVAALRRHSRDSETLPVEDARETIVKYNALFSLGLSQSDIDVTLRKCERHGVVEVDDIIDGLGILEGV